MDARANVNIRESRFNRYSFVFMSVCMPARTATAAKYFDGGCTGIFQCTFHHAKLLLFRRCARTIAPSTFPQNISFDARGFATRPVLLMFQIIIVLCHRVRPPGES